MSDISITEEHLMCFFECEPELREPDALWSQNDALYQYAHKAFSLSFSIDPNYKDVRLILKYEQRVIFELNAQNVMDVFYYNDSGNETLKINITDTQYLLLKLTPTITITQSAEVL